MNGIMNTKISFGNKEKNMRLSFNGYEIKEITQIMNAIANSIDDTDSLRYYNKVINLPERKKKDKQQSVPESTKQATERKRLPNMYDEFGNEIKESEVFKRFKCSKCNQGMFLSNDLFTIVSINSKLYKIENSLLSFDEIKRAYLDKDKDQYYDTFKNIYNELSLEFLNSKEYEEIAGLVYSEDDFYICPVCGQKESLKDFIEEYKKNSIEYPICNICSGEVENVLNQHGTYRECAVCKIKL